MAGQFEQSECLFAPNAGKLREEVVEGVAAPEVNKERVRRDSRPGEAGRPAEDVGMGEDDRHEVMVGDGIGGWH